MKTAKEVLEAQILALPLLQYDWIPTEQLSFKQEVRDICVQECPMYGKSWSCPPGVGSVDDCRSACLLYPEVFVFTTLAEVSDVANLEETLETRRAHEKITRTIGEIFEKEGYEIKMLSSESCAVCERCSYLDHKPCRHPEYMIPCIESQGILVTEVAEKLGIPFLESMTCVQWFGFVLYREKRESGNSRK